MRQGLPDYSIYLPHSIEQLAEMISSFAADAYESHGLTGTEWRVLAMLNAHSRVLQKDIAAGVGVEKVVAWRAITSLRKKRLISREFCEGDYRAYELFLTEAGYLRFQDTVPMAREREAALTVGLTRDEARLLCALLKKLAPSENGPEGAPNDGGHDEHETFSAPEPAGFEASERASAA